MKIKITFLRKKEFLLPCLLSLIMINASAQNTTTVTGTVMNENGELLSGVTVKATDQGSNESFTSTTNEKGLFSFSKLKVGTSYTLSASYVGYDVNTSTVISPMQNGSNSVLIRLQPSNNALNEVVVIGYGTQKRETVTGAIATVRAEDFNTGQINDPITLIAGKVAGLSLSNTDRSDPNAGADISLRGPATATGTETRLKLAFDQSASSLSSDSAIGSWRTTGTTIGRPDSATRPATPIPKRGRSCSAESPYAARTSSIRSSGSAT